MATQPEKQSGVIDEVQQILAMNPDLTLDEINAFLAQRMQRQNEQPIDDSFGLSPNQMQDWLYAPFAELTGVAFRVPSAFEGSPVMRYLSLMLEFAHSQGGRDQADSERQLACQVGSAGQCAAA